MLGKRSPQGSLFSADQQLFSFVGEDSFYCYLAEHRHEIFHDEDYASLYCANNGRASVPPSDLACALVLQWYDGVSDEEAAARAKYDLRWKVALGIGMDEVLFVKSTLQLFRTQLVVHEQMKQLFDASLRYARALGYFKSRSITVALDTTPIFGRGAVEDTYNLLAESVRQVLRALARVEKTSVEAYAHDHDLSRYLAPSFKGTVVINWDNQGERQTVLRDLVADCDRVLELVRAVLLAHAEDAASVKEVEEAAELLGKILAQDIRRKDSGEAEIMKGVAPDRIISVHDPEMRHGRKSASQLFDGHKGAAAGDTGSQLVTAVGLLPGNAHDAANKEELLKQSEDNTGATVAASLGDTAFGSIEERLAARKTGRKLIAPVPSAPRTGRFTKEEFTIDLDAGSVTCPAGKISNKWFANKYRTKRGTIFNNRTFQFAVDQCKECPLRDQCIKPEVPSRTVSVHEHEALLQEAKRMQQTEEFRALYRTRVLIEHRIARLVQLGLRQARYCGTAKVLFQLAMTAAVANLTLIATRVIAHGSFSLVPLRWVALIVSIDALLTRNELIEPTISTNVQMSSPFHVRALKKGGSRLRF